MRQRRRILVRLLLLGALAAVLLLRASSLAGGAAAGLRLCARVLIPSLFPFFVLANLLIQTGAAALVSQALADRLAAWFSVPPCGLTALFLGLIGGYPIGAATLCALYQEGSLPQEDAVRLLRFCNNSGPAFFLGAVGLGCFGSASVGLRIYFFHALSAILVGLLLARPQLPHASAPDAKPPTTRSFAPAFSAALTASVQSMLQICGLVILFSALQAVALSLGLEKPLCRLLSACGLPDSAALPLLRGAMEMTSGIAALPSSLPLPLSAALCAAICSFGGLCVFLQCAALLPPQLSLRGYLPAKLLQAVLAAALTLLSYRLAPPAFLGFCVCLPFLAALPTKIRQKLKTATGNSEKLPI